MRSFAVIGIVFITAAIVSVLWLRRLQPDDIDSFNKAVAGMEKLMPANKPFSLQLINTGSEYQCYTRYFFVPRHMYYPDIKTDMVMIVSDNAGKDSVARYLANGRKVLWQNEDGRHMYFLTCSR